MSSRARHNLEARQRTREPAAGNLPRVVFTLFGNSRRTWNRAACSAEDLGEVLLNEIVPPVDLEVAVDFADLSLDRVLVAGNGELLAGISVVIRAVNEEDELRDLAAIRMRELEVIHDPSSIGLGARLLELLPGLISGGGLLDLDTILSIVELVDNVSVLSSHSEVLELLSDDVRHSETSLHGYLGML